ncbi:hypothetical protein PF007_g18327 [Phytophthora fragariae]|uniref:Uncharacterized protein n=1 Tax=Phytophthora fragariae TaxID=53985 RepID=A0A6A3RA21_9STRA|nr:hypothetical protein PF007_g18327 [Phytophthora fragariae]
MRRRRSANGGVLFVAGEDGVLLAETKDGGWRRVAGGRRQQWTAEDYVRWRTADASVRPRMAEDCVRRKKTVG